MSVPALGRPAGRRREQALRAGGRLARPAGVAPAAARRDRRPDRRPGARAPVVAMLGAGVALGWWAGIALAVSAVAAGGCALLLRRDALRRADTRAEREQAALAVRLIDAELHAGAGPADALAAAARAAPRHAETLDRAAGEACRGGSAAAVLATDAYLTDLARAWTLGERSGSALAAVLGRLAADLAAGRASDRGVAVALAGPRASALLLAGLPLLGLGLGVAMGADPAGFLLTTAAGRLVCCAGVLLDVAGVLWVRRIVTVAATEPGPPAPGQPPRRRLIVQDAMTAVAAVTLAVVGVGGRPGVLAGAVAVPVAVVAVRRLRARRAPPPPDRRLALTLDLAAAGLRAGRPLADALQLAVGTVEVSRDVTGAQLRHVALLSRLGADAAQAWAAVPPDGPVGPVAVTAVRSAHSGIRLAAAFERQAVELREAATAAAAMRAHRAGIAAMGPLAACFLPSFVCLGIVPVIVGVARSAFEVLP